MTTQLTTFPIQPSFFEPQDSTTAAWLGMAGVLINARGRILLIDPLIVSTFKDGREISEEGYKLKVPLPIQARDIPQADLVCYTHADDDHLGRMTAKALAERLTCRFLAPAPVAQRLVELGIDPSRIDTAKDYDSLHLGPLEVLVTPALHDWQEHNPWQRNDCCGYLVRTPDGSLWHPGDTRLIDELLEIKDVDVLFFDVAAVEAHLGPAGSARLAASCDARILVAYHYGTFDLPPGSFASFDPEDALPYVQGLSAKFVRPNPGELIKVV